MSETKRKTKDSERCLTCGKLFEPGPHTTARDVAQAHESMSGHTIAGSVKTPRKDGEAGGRCRNMMGHNWKTRSDGRTLCFYCGAERPAPVAQPRKIVQPHAPYPACCGEPLKPEPRILAECWTCGPEFTVCDSCDAPELKCRCANFRRGDHKFFPYPLVGTQMPEHRSAGHDVREIPRGYGGLPD